MAKQTHPGKISFYENVDGVERLVKIDDVSNLPESMRFHKNASGDEVPVVKTVAMKGPDGRVKEIITFGPRGEFLQSTLAAPPPPRQNRPSKEPEPARS